MQGFDFSAMNYVDYISLVIVLISIGFGFYRGFITSAISLMGWVLSIVLTYQFYPAIEQHLLNYIKSKEFVIVLGSGGLFILLLIVFAILNAIFYKLIGNLKRSFFDRMIGVLFGLVRGFLIVSFLFMCFTISLKLLVGKKHHLTEEDYPKAISKALTFELMESGANAIENILPESFSKRFEKVFVTVSKKDGDDKFVKQTIEKLTQFAAPEQIKSINLKRQELKSEESQEMIDIKTVEHLLEIYNEKLKSGEVKQKVLTKDEMERLETIIENHLD